MGGHRLEMDVDERPFNHGPNFKGAKVATLQKRRAGPDYTFPPFRSRLITTRAYSELGELLRSIVELGEAFRCKGQDARITARARRDGPRNLEYRRHGPVTTAVAEV